MKQIIDLYSSAKRVLLAAKNMAATQHVNQISIGRSVARSW